MDALFHEAYGHMRTANTFAPGCVYTMTCRKPFKNSILLFPFPGLFFCSFVKVFNTSNSFEVSRSDHSNLASSEESIAGAL